MELMSFVINKSKSKSKKVSKYVALFDWNSVG